ncbi:MAG: OmpA family protein, partial [Bacteroidales bacterium]|nr:OmpA family protein [Bacteroidales bacterium]
QVSFPIFGQEKEKEPEPVLAAFVEPEPKPEPEPQEEYDMDISWADDVEPIETPVFDNRLFVKDPGVQDLSDCMRPGMTPEEIVDCLNRNRKDPESVDTRTTEEYKDRINDPNRRANMAVLPKNIPCKDCETKPTQLSVKETLTVQSGDDKKILKLTDNAGNTTFLDLAPNTKYQINVQNLIATDEAKLPDYISKSDVVKTVSTKDYIIYECIPKLSELGDEVYVNNIYYDFDQSDIIRDGHRELDRLIIIAIKNPHLRFEVTAHADERGSDEYNEALTERRLTSVLEYIRKKGLDMNRLITKAAGKSDPLIKNAITDDEHALNRRTTIRLSDPNATDRLRNTNYDARESSPLSKKGLWFRVQLGAFKVAPEYPLYLYKDVLQAIPGTQLHYYQDRDGLYKFTVGEFSDLEQARRLNQRILDANKEAYVVAFMDGQRITIAEAQAIIKRMARK